MTVYVEDIPSNQVDNWARIQADRFRNPVIRGFHTELETVYEEMITFFLSTLNSNSAMFRSSPELESHLELLIPFY